MKKKFFKYLLLYITYIFLLCLCYVNFIAQTYAYVGFYINMDVTSCIMSIALLILSFIFIYKQKTNTYSKLVIYILFIVNYIPSVILYCFMPQEIAYILMLTIYWVMIVFCVNFADKIKINKKKLQWLDRLGAKTWKPLYGVILVELIVTLFVMSRTGINLSFENVYQLRYNYLSTEIPTVFLYLFAASKVINPVLFIYLKKRGKKVGAVASFCIQILSFLCDGSKSTLFSLAIAIIIAYGKKGVRDYDYLKDNNFKTFLLGGITAANAVGAFEYFVIGTKYIFNYFIRRLFFIPAYLHIKYYDFFSNNSIDFFRQSVLGKIGITSAYSTPIQNIIGAQYFNDASMIANNGLFSDAYANLGVAGVIIMPILVVCALKILDYSAKDIKPMYIITVLISVPYIFLSSSFFTVMLTHGFIALCLILKFIIPKEKIEADGEK